jgi:hypothetical protein
VDGADLPSPNLISQFAISSLRLQIETSRRTDKHKDLVVVGRNDVIGIVGEGKAETRMNYES